MASALRFRYAGAKLHHCAVRLNSGVRPVKSTTTCLVATVLDLRPFVPDQNQLAWTEREKILQAQLLRAASSVTTLRHVQAGLWARFSQLLTPCSRCGHNDLLRDANRRSGMSDLQFTARATGLTIRSSRHRFVASPLRLRYASAKLSPLRGAA